MLTDKTYVQFLEELRHHIKLSRIEAVKVVNRKLLHLYWELGKRILEKQEEHGWGKSVVEQLSTDLQRAFPKNTNFSSRNLWFMRQVYAE